MTIQSFAPYIPFLAVLFAAFSLIQTLRHKRQGIAAAVFALVCIGAPLITYIVSTDLSTRASLLSSIITNAAIVFGTSLLILFIEHRGTKHDKDRSYGMLGIGVSLFLAITMFGMSLVGSGTSSISTITASTSNVTANQSNLVMVAAVTTGVPFNQSDTTTTSGQAANTTSPNAGSASNISGNPLPTNGQTFPSVATTTSNGLVLATNTPQPPQQIQPSTYDTSIRPTQIVFPTATSTPVATDAPIAASTTETTNTDTAASSATCALLVDYNLNLRDQPTTDGSKVYLSIPFGTTVMTDAKTNDGWYRVTYNGQSGWISSEYVSAATACTSLPTVKAS